MHCYVVIVTFNHTLIITTHTYLQLHPSSIILFFLSYPPLADLHMHTHIRHTHTYIFFFSHLAFLFFAYWLIDNGVYPCFLQLFVYMLSRVGNAVSHWHKICESCTWWWPYYVFVCIVHRWSYCCSSSNTRPSLYSRIMIRRGLFCSLKQQETMWTLKRICPNICDASIKKR